MNGDGAQLIGVNRPALELPFKPFTLDEVTQITGVPPNVLDRWLKPMIGHPNGVLILRRGQGAQGLDIMQTFAAFVGWRYIEEGAPQGRAEQVMLYLVNGSSFDGLRKEWEHGRNFVVPLEQLREAGMTENHPDPSMRLPRGLAGMMIPAPENVAGQRLRLDVLFEEFDLRLSKVFPKVTQVGHG